MTCVHLEEEVKLVICCVHTLFHVSHVLVISQMGATKFVLKADPPRRAARPRIFHWTWHKCEINVFSLKSLKFGGSFNSQPIVTNTFLLKNTFRGRVKHSDHFREAIRFHLDQ